MPDAEDADGTTLPPTGPIEDQRSLHSAEDAKFEVGSTSTGSGEATPRRRGKLSVTFNPADLERTPSRVLQQRDTQNPSDINHSITSPVHTAVPRVGPKNHAGIALPRMRTPPARSNSASSGKRPSLSGDGSSAGPAIIQSDQEDGLPEYNLPRLKLLQATDPWSSGLLQGLGSVDQLSPEFSEDRFLTTKRSLEAEELNGRRTAMTAERNQRRMAEDIFQRQLADLLLETEQRIRDREAALRARGRAALVQRHVFLAFQMKLLDCEGAEEEMRHAIFSAEYVARQGLLRYHHRAMVPFRQCFQVADEESRARKGIISHWKRALESQCRLLALDMEEREMRHSILVMMADSWDALADEFTRGAAVAWLHLFDAQLDLQRIERGQRRGIALEEKGTRNALEQRIHAIINDQQEREEENCANSPVPSQKRLFKPPAAPLPPMTLSPTLSSAAPPPQPQEASSDGVGLTSTGSFHFAPPMRPPMPRQLMTPASASSSLWPTSPPEALGEDISLRRGASAVSFAAPPSRQSLAQATRKLEDDFAPALSSAYTPLALPGSSRPSSSLGPAMDFNRSISRRPRPGITPLQAPSAVPSPTISSKQSIRSAASMTPAGTSYILVKDLRAAFQMDMMDGKVDGRYFGADIVTRIRDPAMGYITVSPKSAAEYQELLQWEGQAKMMNVPDLPPQLSGADLPPQMLTAAANFSYRPALSAVHSRGSGGLGTPIGKR